MDMETKLTVGEPAEPAVASGGQEDRFRRLVDAADALLDEDGLEGLTIRAVLARTGLARRAFYECFHGKDDLVLAVFDQTLRRAADHFRDLATQAKGPVEALEQIVIGIVLGQLGTSQTGGVGNHRSAALSREHLRLAEARPGDLQSALKPLIDLFAELVRQGMEQGVLRPCDPELQARLIYNLVSTTTHTELLADEGEVVDKEGREVLAATIWTFCRRAIVA